MHRDIKPANFILNNGTWKICDYGLARICEGDTMAAT